MIIPLHLDKDNCEDDTPREWSMIELNGEVLPPREICPDSSNVELGGIRFNSDGAPTMTIASHELKGEVCDLKQPLVVLKKRKRSSKGNNGCVNDSVEYEITGVIKKKILFVHYPKSIMR